jgi:CheY-like chemotaxis protein
MLRKNNGTLMLLPELLLSENLSKNHETQDDNLFLPSYNIDFSTGNNIKRHKPRKTRRISNDDVLTNARSDSQNRIMVVDDEQDVARLFAISLERNGFVVDVFNDPLSALSNYKASYYDLLLLDIKMPGMNGFELYQKIKDRDNEARVCFLTAYEESLIDLRKSFPGLEEEVDCFLRKPIEMHNLVRLVKSKIGHN